MAINITSHFNIKLYDFFKITNGSYGVLRQLKTFFNNKLT